jgi:hypothetical protein
VCVTVEVVDDVVGACGRMAVVLEPVSALRVRAAEAPPPQAASASDRHTAVVMRQERPAISIASRAA